MSAPRTDIEKQKKWHRAPLIGSALVVLFGVAMLVFWLMHEVRVDSASKPPPEAIGTGAATDGSAGTTSGTVTAPDGSGSGTVSP